MDKKYSKLGQNSNSILTGIEEYCLEEERTKKYKKEIRDMWMKYDKWVGINTQCNKLKYD